MTIFRSEVATAGVNVEVDRTNKLSQYLKSALIPSQGSGNTVVESVSGQPFDFTNPIEWTVDGARQPTGSEIIAIPDPVGVHQVKGLSGYEILFLVHQQKDGYQSNSTTKTLSLGADGSGGLLLDFYSGRFENPASISVSYGYNKNTVSFDESYPGDGVYGVLVNVDSGAITLYFQGHVLKSHQHTNVASITSNAEVVAKHSFGNPTGYNKMSMILAKEGEFLEEEINEIVSNPYQVFKRAQSSVNEYALTGDGSGFVSVSLPEAVWSSASSSNPISHRLGYIASALEGDTRSTIVLGSGTRHVLRHSPGLCSIGSHSVDLQSLGVDVYELNKFEIVRTFDGTTKSSKLYINDVFIEEVSPSSITLQSYDSLFKLNDTDFRKGRIQCVWQLDSSNSDNNRFYDLNQANEQPYIPELIHGQHGELVSFPDPSGYVRELDSTKGVNFNGIDQYGETDPTLLWGNSDSFAFEFDFFYTGDPNQTLAGDPNGFNNNILIESSTKVIVRMGNSSKTLNLTEPLEVGRHNLAVKRNGFADFGLYDLEDNLLSEPMDPLGGGFSLYGFGIQYNSGYFRQFNGVMYRARFYTDFNRSVLAHDWQFTKASGYSITDDAGSIDIQLVNFDSVRYRPEAGGDLVGYRFRKTSYANFTRFSWFSIEYNEPCALEACFIYDVNGERRYPITTDRNSWSNNQGIGIHENGNIIIGYGRHGSQTQISKDLVNVDSGDFLTVRVEIDPDLTSRVYFSGELVHTQTVSNIQTTEIARIGNWFELNNETYKPFDDTVRYVQVERNSVVTNYWDCSTGDTYQIVDTVGNNHAIIVDAPTAGYLPVLDRRTFTVGEGKDFTDLVSWEPTATFDEYFTVLLIYGAVSSPGILGGSSKLRRGLSIRGITEDAKIQGNLDYRGGTGFSLQNVIHEGGVLKQSYAGEGFFLVENITVEAYDIADNYFSCNEIGVFKNCIIKNLPITFTSDRARLYDCIATKSRRADRAPFRNQQTECYNCISFDNAGNDYESISIGSGCISSDNTAPASGLGVQLTDIATGFASIDNNDYRIKQSYANSNLKGKGWNGSDIASWAYYEDVSGSTDISTVSELNAISSIVSSILVSKRVISNLEAVLDSSLSTQITELINAYVTSSLVANSSIVSTEEFAKVVTQQVIAELSDTAAVQKYMPNTIYGLEFDGKGHIEFPNIPQHTGNWEIEFRAYITEPSAGQDGEFIVIGESDEVKNLIILRQDNTMDYRINGVDYTWPITDRQSADTIYKVTYTPNQLSLFENGELVSTKSIGTPPLGGSSGTGFSSIGTAYSPSNSWIRRSGMLVYLKVSLDGVPERHYVPSSSGTELVDIVNAQNGVQQGSWPSDDSEWVLIEEAIKNATVSTQLQAVIASIASLNSGRLLSSTSSAMSEIYNQASKLTSTMSEVSGSVSLKNSINKAIDAISAITSIGENYQTIETAKVIASTLEVVPTSQVSVTIQKLLSVFDTGSLELEAAIKSQRLLSIVVDALADSNVTVEGTSIKNLLVSMVLSSRAECSASILTSKVLNALNTAASIAVGADVEKLSTIANSVLDGSANILEVITVDKPVNGSSIKATGFTESLITKSITTNTSILGATQIADSIRVMKATDSSLLASLVDDIVIDIDKGVVLTSNAELSDQLNIAVDKNLSNVTISAGGNVLMLILKDFTDTNVITISSSLVVPGNTVTSAIRASSSVITAEIKVVDQWR